MTAGGPSQLFNFRMFLLLDRAPSLRQPRIPAYDGINDQRSDNAYARNYITLTSDDTPKYKKYHDTGKNCYRYRDLQVLSIPCLPDRTDQ